MADHVAFPPSGRIRGTRGHVLLVMLGLLALLGCTPAPSPPGRAVVPAHPPSTEAVAGLLSELAPAAADSERWARRIDPTDPGFAAAADRLRANITQFEVEFVPAGRTEPIADHRSRLLGPSARAHAVRVRWAVPGEAAPAEHLVWVTLTNSVEGARLAGTADAPSERSARPIWWDRTVSVHRAAGTAVLTGPDTDPEPWLASMTGAAATLTRHGLQPQLMVLEVPATAAEFEQILGVPPGSHRRVAATAWPFGAAVRIVVNPGEVPAPGEARQVLLTHEAVHAASGSVEGQVPLWLAEGYADLVALSDRPAATAAHRRQLAEDQRRHGIATTLVTAAELAPTHPRVHENYQRAWLAVSVLDGGRGSAARVHAATVAGVPLDRALVAEGWTETALAAAVHEELVRLAGP